jgi:hypothetical protein
MTVVHPLDLLVLEALSEAVYADLVKAAPSRKAFFEPEDGRFIARVDKHERKYGGLASWKRFQRATFNFTEECRFIVITDVANFYDFINFSHLRNIIAATGPVRESYLDLLTFVLRRLAWIPDYMPPQETGMPQIEASAPRVLANAMLYEVDRLAEDLAVTNCARFMDDINFGVDGIIQAKRLIRDIDLTLQSRQLRLNSSKTKILDARAAHNHFCISENLILSTYDRLAPLVGSKPARKARLRGTLLKRYETW